MAACGDDWEMVNDEEGEVVVSDEAEAVVVKMHDDRTAVSIVVTSLRLRQDRMGPSRFVLGHGPPSLRRFSQRQEKGGGGIGHRCRNRCEPILPPCRMGAMSEPIMQRSARRSSE
jgi:hypothetical protein